MKSKLPLFALLAITSLCTSTQFINTYQLTAVMTCACTGTFSTQLLQLTQFFIPGFFLQKLRRLQNRAARVLCGLSRQSHFTYVIEKLHWLPVLSRKKVFKILILMFKFVHHQGFFPSYILHLFDPATLLTLRNYHCSDLFIPRPLSKYGERSLGIAGPKLWKKI